MTRLRWSAQVPPEELGVVVHGPVVLARSPGIVAGLRCVFAHPGGLHLLVVLRAEGVQAEAAGRRTFPRPDDAGHDPCTGPALVADVDGDSRPADPIGQESSGSADHFSQRVAYWIGALPRDGRLQLTFGWPQAGLAETRTVLQLADLDGLEERVLPLR